MENQVHNIYYLAVQESGAPKLVSRVTTNDYPSLPSAGGVILMGDLQYEIAGVVYNSPPPECRDYYVMLELQDSPPGETQEYRRIVEDCIKAEASK